VGYLGEQGERRRGVVLGLLHLGQVGRRVLLPLLPQPGQLLLQAARGITWSSPSLRLRSSCLSPTPDNRTSALSRGNRTSAGRAVPEALPLPSPSHHTPHIISGPKCWFWLVY
jgi:hypothetical protein